MSGRVGCDFCSREGVRIKRRYRTLRYCETCYAREFKRRSCPRCGRTARLPVDRERAVCSHCERREPCSRCGKVDERRGKTTAEGRLCGACVLHQRTPEPCELCGALSSRLARNTRLGHNLRVCPRCARAAHGTCAACRRHRPLEASADGRRVCRPCREEGERPCEACGRATPAGYGRRCRSCEATARARECIQPLAATLEPAPIAEHFASFSDWLIATAGGEKAARDVTRHAVFFKEVGERWGEIPDYAALVAHFGAERLRRQRRAMRWMTEQGLVAVDTAVRENDSERRRITATTGRLPEGSRGREVVNDYCTALGERVRRGELARRSMRLSVTPAVALLEAALAAGRELPDQETLDALLLKAPGQHAALTGFVRWLREEHGIALVLPRKRSAATLRRRRETARREMLALLREGAGADDFAERWRVAALAYFHDLTQKAARKVCEDDVHADHDGLRVDIKGEGHWIPAPPTAGAEKGAR